MRSNNATKRMNRRGGLTVLSIAALVSVLLTCDKVPDYCGTGELYDPSCAFCFGSRAYPLCSDGKYNPLVQGCDSTTNKIGTRCANGSFVPLGTPCGGYTLTVGWTPRDGGEVDTGVLGRTNFTAGEKATLVAIPKPEYEFAGWTGALTSATKEDTYVVGGSKPQITIIAMFKPKAAGSLIVDAFPQGAGEVTRNPDKGTYEDGDEVTVTAKRKPGYVFDGWSGASTSKDSVIKVLMKLDSSKTLVAIFTPVVHTLKATANPSDGGAVYINNTAMLGGESRDVGAEVSVWAMPNEGYAFSHWKTDGGATFTDEGNPNTVVTLDAANPTITAVFTRGSGATTTEPPPPTFTLTTKAIPSNGGSVTVNPEGPYNAGVTVTATAVPNDGYTFNGWSGALTSGVTSVNITMSEDKTLTANFQWVAGGGGGNDSAKAPVYTVTFDANGGTPVAPSSAKTGTDGKLTDWPNEPEMNGHTFNGWFTAATGGDAVYANTKFVTNITIYAQWTPVGSVGKSYTVIFNPNGGKVTPSSATTRGDTLTLASLPIPSRIGYEFDGWFTETAGGTQVTKNTVFDAHDTVYAQWAILNYTIDYNLDGGTTGAVVNPSSYNIETLPITLYNPTRSGYKFIGWTGTNGPNPDTSVTIGKESTGNRTYNANWKQNTFRITFDPNGGTVLPTSDTTYNGKLMWLPKPKLQGYDFDGWFTGRASGSGTLVDTNTVFNKNDTIFAHWTEVAPTTYTLTVLPNPSYGGTTLPQGSQIVNAGEKIPIVATPDNGYAFVNWTLTGNGTLDRADTAITWVTVNDGEVWVKANFEVSSGGCGGEVVVSTFTDSRDGKKYKSVKICNQTWMAENLNYEIADSSWCYNDSCYKYADTAKYGRLYTWNAAMTACPSGWHLPSNVEWQTLVDFAGGSSFAGKKLKSTTGWYYYSDSYIGTDNYGFSALPGGTRGSDGDFNLAGVNGYWWTAAERGSGYAYYRDMYYNYDYVIENGSDEDLGYSVRCVRD